MAGAGYKLFNTGDVLTAAQVNTYLMEQTVMVFADDSARTTALTGVVAEGMISFLKDTNSTEYYSGSAWVAISGGASPTSFASLNGAGTALTGATTITVSGLSGYNKFFVAITGASSVSADSAFTIRFNADTASNYTYNGLNFNMQTPNILAGSWLAASATATSFPLLGTLQGAAAAQNGSFTIDGANSSGVKIVDLIGINNWQVNGGLSWIYKGYYTGTSVISSISIISSVGNFDAGTIIVYGGN
jgi:hypothetical protein